MDIVEWMEDCYMKEVESMERESLYVKKRQISVQLSNDVKVDKKCSKKMNRTSIDKGYKRIISGSKILIDGCLEGVWSTPIAKELRISYDGKFWIHTNSENCEICGLYCECLGVNGLWRRFIDNGKIINNYNLVDCKWTNA
jgi:hypothetical protein